MTRGLQWSRILEQRFRMKDFPIHRRTFHKRKMIYLWCLFSSLLIFLTGPLRNWMNLDIYLYISWGLTTIVYYSLLHETASKWTSNEKQVVFQQLRKTFLQVSSKTSKHFLFTLSISNFLNRIEFNFSVTQRIPFSTTRNSQWIANRIV